MKKVIVLGGSGMLGSMAIDYLSRDPDLRVTATVRTKALVASCKARLPNVDWQLYEAGVSCLWVPHEYDWIINAIGITKPLIHDGNVLEAICINARLPYVIADWARVGGARVLQIATDCVFAGTKGAYVESDLHDPHDVYGKTKSLGEAPGLHHLRCSIVGPEPKAHKFLLDWFLGQPPGASVNGYVNHLWNGITTLHFAKLCHGIITRDMDLPYLQHVIPSGEVTKCELLHNFARYFHREEISIAPARASVVADRTLATNDWGQNAGLWAAAGYSRSPFISEMIEELADYEYRMAKL